MPYDLPWTDLELLVKQRVLEELLKRGYGDQKVKLVLPIFWFEELDVFENFIFQDPFRPGRCRRWRKGPVLLCREYEFRLRGRRHRDFGYRFAVASEAVFYSRPVDDRVELGHGERKRPDVWVSLQPFDQSI